MKEWFIKRGYPKSVIYKEMKKFRFYEQGQKSKEESTSCCQVQL